MWSALHCGQLLAHVEAAAHAGSALHAASLASQHFWALLPLRQVSQAAVGALPAQRELPHSLLHAPVAPQMHASSAWPIAVVSTPSKQHSKHASPDCFAHVAGSGPPDEDELVLPLLDDEPPEEDVLPLLLLVDPEEEPPLLLLEELLPGFMTCS